MNMEDGRKWRAIEERYRWLMIAAEELLERCLLDVEVRRYDNECITLEVVVPGYPDIEIGCGVHLKMDDTDPSLDRWHVSFNARTGGVEPSSVHETLSEAITAMVEQLPAYLTWEAAQLGKARDMVSELAALVCGGAHGLG